MFTLYNYVEHDLTAEIIALFKEPFLNAKSSKKLMKNDTFFLKHILKKYISIQKDDTTLT